MDLMPRTLPPNSSKRRAAVCAWGRKSLVDLNVKQKRLDCKKGRICEIIEACLRGLAAGRRGFGVRLASYKSGSRVTPQEGGTLHIWLRRLRTR